MIHFSLIYTHIKNSIDGQPYHLTQAFKRKKQPRGTIKGGHYMRGCMCTYAYMCGAVDS